MATTIEYGTYIIDLCTAMLEHPRGLTKAQGQRIAQIRQQTVNFLTDYMQHESSALPDLLEYLTHHATPPLETMHHLCEMILDGRCGAIQSNYGEAVAEIQECCHVMYDDIDDMRVNLDQLMSTLGMV
ncbi:MAG: hypothetical protein AAF846_03990 [Chloroflexota bacterium]